MRAAVMYEVPRFCRTRAPHLKHAVPFLQDPERTKDPVEFVQRLLAEKDKYDRIIANSFANDKVFQNTLNQAFEHFINLNQRSPEYISLFMDDKLRKGLKVRNCPAHLCSPRRSVRGHNAVVCWLQPLRKLAGGVSIPVAYLQFQKPVHDC